MTIWFTSDLHFGHANIIKYCNRPFESVDHMNQELIRRWNEKVQPEDTVWVLGDVAMGKLKETVPLVAQLNGDKHLVAGNHDGCWKYHKKADKMAALYFDAGFRSIWTEAWSTLPFGDKDIKFQMHHFPFVGDSHDTDRYSEMRPIDKGQILLHGHVHDAWKAKPRMVNVGCDVWGYAPVTFDQLMSAIAECED